MDIAFLCSPSEVINGGLRQTYRMAQLLADHGFDVKMFDQFARRPSWFDSTIPIHGQGFFHPDPNQIFVLPEDQYQLLENVRSWPQKKVVYSQNHFYGALGIDKVKSLTDYGITDILCSSQTILNHTEVRHPECRAHLIPCGIDRAVFKPLAKRKQIAYMPRKRPIDALYIQDMFRFLYPDYVEVDWVEIRHKTEAETAQILGESAVFLSLSRLEGLGLTPLEAMSAGCVVAGFTGGGGWEYATDENGFWADEDDFSTCVAQLAEAVKLSIIDGPALEKGRAAAEATLKNYSLELFSKATLDFWQKILK